MFVTHLCLNKVAERAARFEPIGLAEVLAKLLHALVKSHVWNVLLVEHIEQVV